MISLIVTAETSQFKMDTPDSQFNDWGMWFYMYQDCPVFLYECRMYEGRFEVRGVKIIHTKPKVVDFVLSKGRKRTPKELEKIKKRTPEININQAGREFVTFLAAMAHSPGLSGSLWFRDEESYWKLLPTFVKSRSDKEHSYSISPTSTRIIIAQALLR